MSHRGTLLYLVDIMMPEHTVRKTSEDLQKILDLEDSGLQKAVDIKNLKPKRFVDACTICFAFSRLYVDWCMVTSKVRLLFGNVLNYFTV